jgi:hypothetical protein
MTVWAHRNHLALSPCFFNDLSGFQDYTARFGIGDVLFTQLQLLAPIADASREPHEHPEWTDLPLTIRARKDLSVLFGAQFQVLAFSRECDQCPSLETDGDIAYFDWFEWDDH